VVRSEPRIGFGHARRPEAWKSLSETEAALLDFLRKGGSTSELSAERTIQKTLALLAKDRHLERLLKVADSEPPRVRALLGALAEELERDPAARARLRASLNPLSRSDFGQFTSLTPRASGRPRSEDERTVKTACLKPIFRMGLYSRGVSKDRHAAYLIKARRLILRSKGRIH
jgi:hypothetical protein